MSIMPKNDIVPVLTFHSVGMNEPDWIWNQLSERADAFEQLLKKLHAHDYRTVSLSDLYAHMTGEKICAAKSIVLVFDDGYLDNWVTVYPLLKKYGMCGTIYVNPDFVDAGADLRPTIETDDDAPQTGFMNWAELRAVDQSGVLDVQSHSLTHTWYYVSPNIVDFYAPSTAKRYPWMAWNAKPERKPYYLEEDQSTFVALGTPVFEHEKSLLARRFTPDAGLVDELVTTVEQEGGTRFFDAEDWRQKLQRLSSTITGEATFPGEMESESDYEARVRYELAQSKTVIEKKLDKTVNFLCWPGGGVNATAKRLAEEVGYQSWTLSSSEKPAKRNRPGEDPREIKRLPAIRDVRFFDRKWGVGSELLVYLEMQAHRESRAFDLVRKAYKVGVAAGIAGRR